MTIDGNAEKKRSLIYHGAGCYRKRQKARDRQQYCFGEQEGDNNIWGCLRMDMAICVQSPWTSCGEYDDNRVWHFNKRKIRTMLEDKIHANALCPVMVPDHILETLDHLPDTVDPRTDPHWEYYEIADFTGATYAEFMGKEVIGGGKVVAGLSPVSEQMLDYVIGDFHPQWNLGVSESIVLFKD